MKTPFLLVGDGPAEPSGLGRIARDLAGLIATSDLPVDLVQIGGTVPPVWNQWRHYPLDRDEDWGAPCVERYWRELWGTEPGILLVVWDPGRLLPYAQIDIPAQRWTYTAVDGANVQRQLTGPAQAALQRFDRVLGYGRYGAEVLKRTLDRDIPYLPHGIMPEVYTTPATEAEQAWVRSILGPFCRPNDLVLGAVMANQPRKDFGIFFATIRELLQRGRKVFGWLHTDTLVKAWAVQQLVADFGLEKHVRITLDPYQDRALACLYQRCALTLLPTLGEGFGYTIVESLASGRPCIHTDCAGGAELVPRTEWRVPVRQTRLEGIYALDRPVTLAEDWANAVERCLDWQAALTPEIVRAYCAGSVAHLSWSALWPRWRSWIKQGLE